MKSGHAYRHRFRELEDESRSIVPTLSNDPLDRMTFRELAARIGTFVDSIEGNDLL
jgi:hypothetical protein